VLSFNIMIRPLNAADYDAVREVWRAAGLAVRPTGRDARVPFLRQLRQFPTTYLAAELDGRIVGAVLGTHDGRKGWINRLAVRPDCRRRGIARKLLAACEAELQRLGIEIVAALVEADNADSAAMFRAAGYRDDVAVAYFRKLARPDI
jgi:ribosomal protein S18 acetylase RimI-like enzyme